MDAPTTSYHLRPVRGWLNDPNGITRVDGVWHVFYQHNPHAPVHGRISWGHATSRDLAHWEHEPIAFSPTPGGPDSFGCWSGVFVPGHDRPAVAYSGVVDASAGSTICLRWGSPDLRDWGPPVVVGRTPGSDGIVIMRDPYVLEHQGRRLAVLGAGLADGSPAIALFDRERETDWRYIGLLVDDDPLLRRIGGADIWECPQLFPLGGRWVLIVSLNHQGRLGEVAAAIGDLVERDGRLRFISESAHILDDGADLYAPQVALTDADPLLLGWVRQPDQDPAVRDHSGCLSLPRRLSLVGREVRSRIDLGAATALIGEASELPAGRTALADRRWAIDILGDGARLSHPARGVIDLSLGDQIWVDGAVLELYRYSGIPATWRHDEPWELCCATDRTARAADVIPRVP